MWRFYCMIRSLINLQLPRCRRGLRELMTHEAKQEVEF